MKYALLMLTFGLTAPAMAAPLDLGDEEEDLLGDDLLGDLTRGSTSAGEEDKKKKRGNTDDSFDTMEFDEPDDFGLLEDEPDELLRDFEEPPLSPAPMTPTGPGTIDLDVAGKEPLQDNYPVTVVAVDRDAVVVELPVLLSRSRVAVTEPFLINADIRVADTTVTTVSQVVHPASLAEFGPSFTWIKALAPVIEPMGEIAVVISTSDLEGTEVNELFTRVTPYALR